MTSTLTRRAALKMGAVFFLMPALVGKELAASVPIWPKLLDRQFKFGRPFVLAMSDYVNFGSCCISVSKKGDVAHLKLNSPEVAEIYGKQPGQAVLDCDGEHGGSAELDL